MFSKAGIVGLGMIGGSLAKALKNRAEIGEIVAFNRNEDVLSSAYKEGTIDKYTTTIDETFRNCDIVFICTPVDKIFDYANMLMPYLNRNCVITDVGSTKAGIYEKMKSLDVFFIGGHPMTGTEKFRYTASKEHLFENAYYILTPSEKTPGDITEKFKDLIAQIGAIPIIISPYEHDKIVASISHVPHIVAAVLVNMVKKTDSPKKHMRELAAGGFKDITRIASSNPDMWESICLENKDEILNVLSEFENIVYEIKEKINSENSGEIYSFFKTAKQYRDSFVTINQGNFVKSYDITVDLVDKPGGIAYITGVFSNHNINIKNLSIISNREQENGALFVSFSSEEERQKSVGLLKALNFEVQIKD